MANNKKSTKKSSGGSKKRVTPNFMRAGTKSNGSRLSGGGNKKACGGKKN